VLYYVFGEDGFSWCFTTCLEKPILIDLLLKLCVFEITTIPLFNELKDKVNIAMGFCSSTCTSNDIMTNKKVVTEVRELLGNLMDILNKMDSAAAENGAKESEASPVVNKDKTPTKAIEESLPKTLTRASAKQFILRVNSPFVMSLRHSDLSMVKHLCMLTYNYGFRTSSTGMTELNILSKRIVDAISNEDLPSLRYFHSWLSDYEDFALNESQMIEIAIGRPNLRIIKYMRDEMGVNFYKELKRYDFKICKKHWGFNKRLSINSFCWNPCFHGNLWDLLCVLHELNYAKYDEFITKLVMEGRMALVIRAFKSGYVTRTKMESLMVQFECVFVDWLMKC